MNSFATTMAIPKAVTATLRNNTAMVGTRMKAPKGLSMKKVKLTMKKPRKLMARGITDNILTPRKPLIPAPSKIKIGSNPLRARRMKPFQASTPPSAGGMDGNQ
jgi:hypothetical protein